VYYAGRSSSGHAFILDGYNNNEEFHFNWGWGGRYDGWFISTALIPDASHDYSYEQDAIINIMPNRGSIPQSGYNLRLAQPITLTNIEGDTINDNRIFQDSALIVKVGIHNSGTNDFFGKIIITMENELGREIISEKYVTIPASIYYYPFDFYTPKINSIGGDYQIKIFYTTNDEEYYMVNNWYAMTYNPLNVFVVGLYMPKLEVSGNTILTTDNYNSVDSLNVIFSNIGQKPLSNLTLSFAQGFFERNGNIADMVLPTNSTSVKFAPVLGLDIGTYKDTLIITGDNDIYLRYPLEFRVMHASEYYAASFNVNSIIFEKTVFGYSAETRNAIFSNMGKLTGLIASFKEGTAFELVNAFPSELQFNSSTQVSIKTKSGLTPNVYIDTLFIKGDNGIMEKLLLKFEVAKALINISSLPSLQLEAVVGDTLKNIVLPEFYSWQNPNLIFSFPLSASLPAIYNPNADLYQDAHVSIIIFVSALSNAIKWNPIIAEIPQNANVQFYNLKGNLVAQPLPPGIYIAKMRGEKFNLNKKIIVKD
jgi:hypothetical protein